MFDDYHCIENQGVHQLVTFFLEHTPPTCHICLTTRADPPFPLARLRSRGLLTEIRARELAFTDAEITELYASLGHALSAQDVALLESRTEGWIAGLQLAGLSIQGKNDVSAFIRRFSGTHRYILDYLMEEVLGNQPDTMQEFLLQTSILDRLCGDLCDAVLERTDSQTVLEHLESSDFFVFALDEERQWFRYHHLLADVLRHRLKQVNAPVIPDLHNRAAYWFAGRKLYPEALTHAFAAHNDDLAGSVLEILAKRVWEGGTAFSLLHWFEQLPGKTLSLNPNLAVFYAKELLYSGQGQQAHELLVKTEQSLPMIDRIDDAEKQIISGSIATMQALMLMYRGDIPAQLQQCDRALDLLAGYQSPWLAIATGLAGIAYYWDGPGNIRKAKQLLEEAARLDQSGNAYAHLTREMQYAMILKAQGQLSQAYQLDSGLLDFARRHRLDKTGMTGAILTELGDILCERGQCEQGIAMITKGIELAEKAGTTMIRWLNYTNLTRAYLYQGNYAKAKQTLDTTFELLKKERLASWYLCQTSAMQGHLLLLTNDLAGATHWAEQRQLAHDAEMIHIREQEYLVYARLLIAQQQYDTALDVLNRMLAIAEPDTRVRASIEMHLLKSMALHYQKQADAAVREAAHSLALAEEGGYTNLFLLEGPLAAKLIQDVLTAPDMACSRAYIQCILDAFPDMPRAVKRNLFPDELSEREIDVLREVAQGFSNKEIADRLYISLNTVKSHIKQILSKLDVKNRTDAVRKGRELGLV